MCTTNLDLRSSSFTYTTANSDQIYIYFDQDSGALFEYDFQNGQLHEIPRWLMNREGDMIEDLAHKIFFGD